MVAALKRACIQRAELVARSSTPAERPPRYSTQQSAWARSRLRSKVWRSSAPGSQSALREALRRALNLCPMQSYFVGPQCNLRHQTVARHRQSVPMTTWRAGILGAANRGNDEQSNTRCASSLRSRSFAMRHHVNVMMRSPESEFGTRFGIGFERTLQPRSGHFVRAWRSAFPAGITTLASAVSGVVHNPSAAIARSRADRPRAAVGAKLALRGGGPRRAGKTSCHDRPWRRTNDVAGTRSVRLAGRKPSPSVKRPRRTERVPAPYRPDSESYHDP
jgi:hypothetical protein